MKELMRKWKTRFEIWSDGEKITSRWIQILWGSYKVIATPQLGFVSVKYQYVYYSNITMNTEWESQAIVSSKENIACL